MKVLNAEPFMYSNKAIQNWKEKGYEYIASSWEEINTKEIIKGVTVLIIRLNRYVDDSSLKKFPDLKYVISATTGYDHVDLEYLNENNIEFVSLRGHKEFLNTIPSTAEHTWALLMALIRKVPEANEHVKKGKWNRDLFRGYQLKNKTLGIIGLGRTGSKVANYAKVFDMNVQYYDPFVNKTNFSKCLNIQELFENSDIITFHIHLDSETKNFINKENIGLIRKGAFLINTSRGRIWDENVIVKALQENWIAGVASDVLATELDDIRNSFFWKAQQMGENIILTPHIGGATYDAMWTCEEYVVNRIE